MPTEREAEVLSLIRGNPMMSQDQIATRLGITRSSVASHVSALIAERQILGRGYVVADDPYVVVAGGANVDIEGRCSAPPIEHESNPGEVLMSAGGVGRNIAANLATSGVRTLLITALGEDDHGQFLYNKTSSAGVDLSSVLWTTQYRTATYLSIIDASGDLTMAVNDMAIIASIDRSVIAARRDVLRYAKVVVTDCNLNDDALDEVTNVAAAVFVDPTSVIKAPRIVPYLSRVHTLKPNRAEASALTGISVIDHDSANRAIDWLIAAGVSTVFLTLGPDGAMWADHTGQRGKLGALPADLVSTTGAGDAFTAALVRGFCNGTPHDELAAAAATQAAAMAATTASSC